MDASTAFALVLTDEPVVHSAVEAKGRQLDDRVTDFVTARYIFIPDGDGHVVTNVFHIDVEPL
jgi:hypothetical protein